MSESYFCLIRTFEVSSFSVFVAGVDAISSFFWSQSASFSVLHHFRLQIVFPYLIKLRDCASATGGGCSRAAGCGNAT